MKYVFITGVSSGIGLELAKAYLQKNNYHVIGCDIQDCEIKNSNFTFHKLDLSKQEDYIKLVKDIPRPDIWINNAGLAKLGNVESISNADTNLVIGVNINAVILGTQMAIQKMSAPSHGTIVNIASLNGLIPTPFNSVYAASKHAVVGFTRSVQEELRLRKNPIQVCLVLPGFVKTKILESHHNITFPSWLEWSLTKPAEAAKEIILGIERKQPEITCGLNGKTIRSLFKFFPRSTITSTRFLLSSNWREALGLDKIER